jgi:hypothetical protein
MTELNARLLPGATRLVALHVAALNQREALCGPFWGALALQAAAAPDAAVDPALDQDAVALAAGTTILDRDDVSFRPPGAAARTDYRLALPITDDSDQAGTAASGMARAIAQLSDGALSAMPVGGDWSPAALLALLELLDALPAPVTAIANVATAPFWHSRASFARALRYLEEGVDEGARSEWQVGHFVGLLGRISGRRGTLVLVADTYRELGSEGVHRQPLERVARALAREGMAQGGLLLVVRAHVAAELVEAVGSTGLEVGLWDNGSIDVLEGRDARR